jgi:hypothetical protein
VRMLARARRRRVHRRTPSICTSWTRPCVHRLLRWWCMAWHHTGHGLAPPWLACATVPPWTPPWTRQVLCILLLLLSTQSSPSARVLPTESSYAYAAAIVLVVLA